MQKKAQTYLLAIATAVVTTACGGGGDSGDTTSATAAPAASTSPDASCFTLPANGKTATVTASWTAPVEVDIAALTGQGTQPFEGQSYPALDVQTRIAQVTGSNEHHALYMLPNAPFLPAGSMTYPAAGDPDPVQRYAYTYARMTLEQLRSAILAGKAGFSWATGVTIPGLSATVPSASDFQLNTSVTLLMLEQQAGGTNPLPAYFKPRYIRELTLTYAGREDVTVGSTAYAQACKMTLAVRRSNFMGTPFGIDNVATGTAWFAPGVGLVKITNSGTVLGVTTSLTATVAPAQ